jgi:hypothetical protein
MTIKDELLNQVEIHTLHWIEVFGLNITRLYIISDIEDENVSEIVDEGSLFSVSRQPSSAYEIHVFVNLNLLEGMDDKEIKKYCCHEVLHCVLDELCWACGKEDTHAHPGILSKHEEIAEKLSYLLSDEYKENKTVQIYYEMN